MILADVVTAFHTSHGLDAAVMVARQQSGTQFDRASGNYWQGRVSLLEE